MLCSNILLWNGDVEIQALELILLLGWQDMAGRYA